MNPLDYQSPDTHAAKPRQATEVVSEKQAWMGMVWYLLFFLLVGIFLGILRSANL